MKELSKLSAIVTGNSSGIGLQITEKLIEMGYFVYGLSRSNSEHCTENTQLIPCDISQPGQLQDVYNRYLKKDKNLHILVNNAGIGAIGYHEELDDKHLQTMIAINFLAPVLLSRFCLRRLKQNQGYLFNISSISGLKAAALGAAYSATKAGLTHFGNCLFEEGRKKGLKVINIHPDLTKTSFFKRLNYQEGEDRQTYLLPEDIANYIEFILKQRVEVVTTNITLRPQKHGIQRKSVNDT